MANVQFDTNARLTNGSTGTPSWSHTVANQTNRLLVAKVANRNASGGAATATAMTWTVGATVQNFTKSVDQSLESGAARYTWWFLIAPTVGAGTIALTVSKSTTIDTTSTSYYNCDQTSPVTVELNDSGTFGTGSTPYSLSVPNTSVNPFVDYTMVWRSPTTGGIATWSISSPSDATVTSSTLAGTVMGVQFWYVQSGSTPYTATLTILSSSTYYCVIAVRIKAASATQYTASATGHTAVVGAQSRFASLARSCAGGAAVTGSGRRTASLARIATGASTTAGHASRAVACARTVVGGVATSGHAARVAALARASIGVIAASGLATRALSCSRAAVGAARVRAGIVFAALCRLPGRSLAFNTVKARPGAPPEPVTGTALTYRVPR